MANHKSRQQSEGGEFVIFATGLNPSRWRMKTFRELECKMTALGTLETLMQSVPSLILGAHSAAYCEARPSMMPVAGNVSDDEHARVANMATSSGISRS